MMDYELHCGDCLDVMAGMEAGSVDAVICDPPYGRSSGVGDWRSTTRQSTKFTNVYFWDENRPPAAFFDWIKFVPVYVVWGGNYFADYLGACAAPLMWHKCQEWNGAEFELAWTKNIRGNADTFWKSRAVVHSEMNKVHPTQKPLDLMIWCIEKASSPGDTIFDPFMGSGTTGVAALLTGRKFIGIELDAGYFQIAKSRIEKAAQMAAGEFVDKRGSVSDLDGLPMFNLQKV